jgi:hypothetical protein
MGLPGQLLNRCFHRFCDVLARKSSARSQREDGLWTDVTAESRETPQVIAFEPRGVHPVEVVGSEVVEFAPASLRGWAPGHDHFGKRSAVSGIVTER